MKTKDALSYFKSETMSGRQSLLHALNEGGWPITGEAISQWGEYPPLGRQFQIQLITDGQLKASVCHKLNITNKA